MQSSCEVQVMTKSTGLRKSFFVYVIPNSNGESEGGLSSAHNFEITPPVDRIEKRVQFPTLNCLTDDGIAYSIHSNLGPSGCLRLLDGNESFQFFSSLLFSHTNRAKYSVTQFCLQIARPARRFCVNRFHLYRVS